MNLKEIVQKLIDNKGVTPYEVSIKSGVAHSTLSRILQGETKRLSIKTKELLANYFNINESLFDNFDLNANNIDISLSKNIPNNAEFEITGNYYPDITSYSGFDLKLKDPNINKIPVKIPNQKGVDYINYYGDTMYPRISAGDMIGINKVDKSNVRPGYPYILIFKNNEVLTTYVKKGSDDKHWLLWAENPKYDQFECAIDDVTEVFLIKSIIIKTTM